MNQGLLLLIFVILLFLLSYLLMKPQKVESSPSYYYPVKSPREDDMSEVLRYKLTNGRTLVKNDTTVFKKIKSPLHPICRMHK